MKSRRATIELCRLLTASRGSLVSGGRLSAELGLTRQAVWKTVRDLAEEGFNIRSVPQKGYILEGTPLYDLAPSMTGALIPPSCPWGEEIFLFDSVGSTQEAAKKIGRQTGADGLVVIAEEQTGGRGRRDRKWFSPRGRGLYFSVFFRPRIPPGRLQLINLAAALAVREGVSASLGAVPDIKWPNDLLIGEKKLCGILSEVSSDSERIRDCCTGIGINVFMDGEETGNYGNSGAAALSSERGVVHRGALCASIIESFYRRVDGLGRDGGNSLLSDYRELCSTIGKKVSVFTDEGVYAGIASGIGIDGELIVEGGDGAKAFCAADVVHATPEAW